jgi:CheY-like chemotaxis protein
MIRKAKNRDALLEGRRILIVEDDVRNVYALTNILEPRGASAGTSSAARAI